MALDYLQDLEHNIESGTAIYACPGQQSHEWHIAKSVEELRQKAQRAANARKYEVHIYRLVNVADIAPGDSFLIVRKILEPGPRGEPRLQWTLVDTKEAAELMRDVSQGPAPYFGATKEESFQPTGA